ncbi:DUF4166 domain-containing protein [Pseudahrensia aquimaris]|uniref:DUF4166 domain-containing protein n=1 Tax=Pseudahrensia aquimaris TaxID=744461 RepID=A0ABW3FGX0_9HYPH
MRVVVLGGYGVFGSRIATLLVRDGMEVWIAGRRRSAVDAEVRRLGSLARPLEVDIDGDLSPIFEPNPQLVIDAVGPFGTYTDRPDPYAVPRACLHHGADYVDLSDDATYTQGIVALDEEAQRLGRRVLSGASSVPGLSSIVASTLVEDMSEVVSIETAILPGNRAPRGTSVIAGIVSQLGRSIRVWRGGVWRPTPVWGEPAAIRLAPDLKRVGRMIEVPDLALFPAEFGARSVTFRAGMEIWPLDRGMQILAMVRRRFPFAVTTRRAGWLRQLATLLEPFGTDRGGMRVAVVGRKAGGQEVELSEWCLVAEAGEGPFMPGIVCRTLARRIANEQKDIAPGARPCLAEATLEEIEDALGDLAVKTTRYRRPFPSLFRSAIGSNWHALPAEVRQLHDVHEMESFSGIARVETGRSFVARIVRTVFGFPNASESVSVRVKKTRHGLPGAPRERWERFFGRQRFMSQLRPSQRAGHIRERFGPLEFELRLEAEASGVNWHVERGWCFGVPLPGKLLPISHTREHVTSDGFSFDVGLHAPFGLGLIVRYVGWLKPDEEAAATSAISELAKQSAES